jgi:hypothetical protein
VKSIATVLQQLSYCHCHLSHCLSLPTALKFVCQSVENTHTIPSTKQPLVILLSAKTNMHNVQEPTKAPVHISHHQQESTSEPRRPVIALPKHRKNKNNTKRTKNISTPTENSTTKMALTSWTEYHESLLKI